MIVDRIENAGLYHGLGERIRFALAALRDQGLLYRQAGRYELRGTEIVALPQSYPTRAPSECKWEAHRRYIDVQYIVEGEEAMGYANIRDMKLTQPYDEAKDVMFFEGQGSVVTVKAGMFAIFFPEDVHKPGMDPGERQTVRKVVMKVLV